jgi:hypothetical protein
MSRVWVVTLFRFTHDEVTGGVGRRREEQERLDGDLPPEAVLVMLERRYARLYQPRWDEETSGVDEPARMDADGDIWVGHEPRLRARLEECLAASEGAGQSAS